MTTTVTVIADDPVTEAGLAAQLRNGPGIVFTADAPTADVAIVGCPQPSARLKALLQQRLGTSSAPVAVVADQLDAEEVAKAASVGVRVMLRRADVTPDLLVRAVVAARNGRVLLPPNIGPITASADPGEPSAITERQRRVLELLAEGSSTSEAAVSLCYSERTVKQELQRITDRYSLRNRTHAVAFALRQGLI